MISSANRMVPVHMFPVLNPSFASSNILGNSLIYNANHIGDEVPPCLTPTLGKKVSDFEDPQVTAADGLM